LLLDLNIGNGICTKRIRRDLQIQQYCLLGRRSLYKTAMTPACINFTNKFCAFRHYLQHSNGL
jgi:hypothetical protein